MILHAIIKNTAKGLLLVFGLARKPIGLENLPKGEGCILVCNHVSDLDPIKLGALIPGYVRYLAKKELFGTRFTNWFLTNLGAIPLNRDSADVGAFKAAEDAISMGELLVIFPEGGRRKVFDVNKGKKGAERLAAKMGCKVVPAGIKGRRIAIGKPMEGSPSTLEIMNGINEILATI